MKKLACAVAVIALVGTPALAADLNKPAYKAPPVPPPAPVYSWTGFYIGAVAGGAWGTFDPSTSTVCNAGFFGCINVAGVDAAGTQSIKPSSFIGGLEGGYNLQVSSVVFGVEGDIEWLHLSGSASTTAAYTGAGPGATCPSANTGQCFTINSSANIDWLATARGRVGYAVNNWLFFATGGAAFTTLKGNFSFADTNPQTEAASISSTKTGYTVGGGIEAGLWSGWTAKVEYLYVNFGTVSTTGFLVQSPTQPLFHSVDLNANIVRVGLNYQFH